MNPFREAYIRDKVIAVDYLGPDLRLLTLSASLKAKTRAYVVLCDRPEYTAVEAYGKHAGKSFPVPFATLSRVRGRVATLYCSNDSWRCFNSRGMQHNPRPFSARLTCPSQELLLEFMKDFARRYA